jgi:predicted ester cyclase
MLSHDEVVALMRREGDPDTYRAVREEWKRHSLAEDRRDLAGLMATLTPDCVYEVVSANAAWHGHEGATRFYTELLTAFPDITFNLTDIVIGPQGVCEEARVTATHKGSWLGSTPNGERIEFQVVIFFPWDPERGKFRGEKVYLHPESVFKRQSRAE